MYEGPPEVHDPHCLLTQYFMIILGVLSTRPFEARCIVKVKLELGTQTKAHSQYC